MLQKSSEYLSIAKLYCMIKLSEVMQEYTNLLNISLYMENLPFWWINIEMEVIYS